DNTNQMKYAAHGAVALIKLPQSFRFTKGIHAKQKITPSKMNPSGLIIAVSVAHDIARHGEEPRVAAANALNIAAMKHWVSMPGTAIVKGAAITNNPASNGYHCANSITTIISSIRQSINAEKMQSVRNTQFQGENPALMPIATKIA
ncbi:MAG: hypothetical protein ABI579_05405, partial [Candidatus Sumerlaeota bacterium]